MIGRYILDAIKILLVIVIAYHIAMFFNWIPKDYQFTVQATKQYRQLKISLAEQSRQYTVIGKTANLGLSGLKWVESFITTRDQGIKTEEETTVRCKENSIYRFFMGMGRHDNTACIPDKTPPPEPAPKTQK